MEQSEALAAYPAEVRISAATVARAAARRSEIIVVLDDDPTGTQSVADLPVLTQWSEADFDWAFGTRASAVYVLTNTRSLPQKDAGIRNREVVANALASAARGGITVRFASRSDSTLRGHYPLETDVIAATLLAVAGVTIDGVIIAPAFPDAGRVTLGGIHYMRSGTTLVPVAETEFARDATFGYSTSRIADWVEEKSLGKYSTEDVIVLDLGIIRSGADAIADAISVASRSTPIVADAVTEDDLRLLSLGIIVAEERGVQLLYRVGPPFVRARIGQEQRAPLRTEEIFRPPGASGFENTKTSAGGLIVVGSHVGLTNRQLERLCADRPEVEQVEIDVSVVLDARAAADHIDTLVSRVTDALSRGDVVVSTSRVLLRTDSPDESLEISRRVSAAVVSAVQAILKKTKPRFVIAKGGITSSDVAAHGLGIRHAIIAGPMLPGIVSLWQPVDGPAVGVPYIVFPGNVGDEESLASVVESLSPRTAVRSGAATTAPRSN
jgi:uncharacterized protein YgbK (DUF1537 family)